MSIPLQILVVAGLLVAAQAAAQPCGPGALFTSGEIVETGSYAAYVATGDFNEDGLADFVITNYAAHTVTVHLGTGGGFFAPKQTLLPYVWTNPRNVVPADFTGDGITDIAVSNYGSGNIVIFPGLGSGGVGNGTFGPAVGTVNVAIPRGFAVHDFNGDGILDIASSSGSYVLIFLGQGTGGVWNGSFTPNGGQDVGGPWGVVAGDWNADGITDLAFANIANGISVTLGNGGGAFQAAQYIVPGVLTTDIVAADLDGDGRLDLATSGSQTRVLLNRTLPGAAATSFDVTVRGTSTNQNGIAAADFNADGLFDLAISNPQVNQVWVFRALGPGQYPVNPETYPVSGGSIGVAADDFDQNGTKDVVVACSVPGAAHVLLSNCGPPAAPVVTQVQPPGGRVGDLVVIHGVSFLGVTGVTFNGVTASFTIMSSTEIEATVPVGATTGPVAVTSPQGTGTSPNDFFVGETPEITSADPLEGKVGAQVVITGLHFTGATRVSFGPASDAPFTVDSDQQITATVDGDAESGPITVTTPAASGTSSFSFTVIPFDTAARIVSVRDVPRDEGGRVTVKWVRSDYDKLQGFITGYRVWRRTPLPSPTAAARLLANPDEYWEPVADVPAARLDGYGLIVATTEDSTEDANPHTAFFIQTLTANPTVFYNSAVDSGYSVDNRGPRKPPKLNATYTARGAVLSWGGNEEPDLWGYRLFRGDTLGFNPDTSHALYAGADTSYTDTMGTGGYYLLAAEDRHGNRSRYALVTPREATVGVALMVEAEAGPREVRVRWYVIGQPNAHVFVERRTADGSWQRRADLVADGAGMVTYRDFDVAPGQRLGYRLGTLEDEQEVFGGEVWVDVPEARLAFLGIGPNPVTSGDLMRVRFVVPHDGRVTFRVLDIAGRTVLREELGLRTAGAHEAQVSWRRRPAAGIYLARLEHDGRAVSTKVGVIR